MGIIENPTKFELMTRDGEIVQVPTGIGILYGLCCGCGQPDRFFRVVREYLEGIEGDSNVAVRLQDDDGFYFVANVISEIAWREPDRSYCNMTEHGSSIFHCWLEDFGRDALEFLREYGDQIFESYEGGGDRFLPAGKHRPIAH